MRTRKELAAVLRERQLERAPMLSAQIGVDINTFKQCVTVLSDEQIIVSYIKCSNCGAFMASLEDVDKVLERNPKDYDEFWNIFDDLIPKHKHI